ncbi:metalloprotease [Streptomyces sp. S1]|uniref:metalloprotease n=1 Tax=Streptomyces sp. S1 TaxID=718288 RepID=UPI001F089CC3|nr:metalloprotease [Streptomyces sp. S1]
MHHRSQTSITSPQGADRRRGVLPKRRAVLAAALAAGTGLALTTPLLTGTAAAAPSTCLNGSLAYDHYSAEAGSSKPLVAQWARNVNWELWGKTSPSGQPQKLTTGMTNYSNGSFSACYQGTANLSEAYMRFSSSAGNLWRVVGAGTANAGEPNWKNTTQYAFNTATRTSPTGSVNLGTVKVPASMQRAFNIVDTLNELYWKRGTSSPCWTANQTSLSTCDTLTFAWRQDGSSGGFWDHPSFPGDTSEGTDWAVLKGDEPDSKHLILHEAGHWFQWQLHGKKWPDVYDCSGHALHVGASTACGWTEGFASAVAAYALGDSKYVFPNGAIYDLLDSNTTKSWDTGDKTESRVTAALLELWGPNGPDGGNWNKTLTLMNKYVSRDFRQYFTEHRPLVNLPTAGTARTIINRHTIIY